VKARDPRLTGVWNATYIAPLLEVQATSRLVISPNGRYQKKDVATNAIWTQTSGRAEVLANHQLKLNIEKSEPKQWCGTEGCLDLHFSPAQNFEFQFDGPNKLLLKGDDAQVIVYQRGE
jgi:hypothetical protein